VLSSATTMRSFIQLQDFAITEHFVSAGGRLRQPQVSRHNCSKWIPYYSFLSVLPRDNPASSIPCDEVSCLLFPEKEHTRHVGLRLSAELGVIRPKHISSIWMSRERTNLGWARPVCHVQDVPTQRLV
jgi:hypothetical protein